MPEILINYADEMIVGVFLFFAGEGNRTQNAIAERLQGSVLI